MFKKCFEAIINILKNSFSTDDVSEKRKKKTEFPRWIKELKCKRTRIIKMCMHVWHRSMPCIYKFVSAVSSSSFSRHDHRQSARKPAAYVNYTAGQRACGRITVGQEA